MSVEFSCDNAVFHFNKKHLTDPTIPMWVIKAKGESYYVEHVTCDVPWSTKETPDNDHTKGSIKIKNCNVIIDDSNHATITPLKKSEDLKKTEKKVRTTVMFYDRDIKDEVLKQFSHDRVKLIKGPCGEDYYITDILDPADLTYMTLKYHDDFRVMMPNEGMYKEYKEWRESSFKEWTAKLFSRSK